MKITHNFDREKLVVVVELQCNLLKKYYGQFVSFLKKEESMPDGYSVQQVSPETAKILIPITTIDKEKEALGFNVSPVMGVIDKFTIHALRYELEHTEFIPLKGYPLENLKEDIKVSVSKKRNLCVLADYDEYLRMEAEHNYTFHQVYCDYGTDEWADVVLDILSDDLEGLNNRLQPKLTLTEWN